MLMMIPLHVVWQILPGIQNTDPAVRNQAVKSLGLCCLRNVDLARERLVVLLQVTLPVPVSFICALCRCSQHLSVSMLCILFLAGLCVSHKFFLLGLAD